MAPDGVIAVLQEALKVLLMVTGPLLIAGFVVGLLISLLQAATQMNDMTISFVPKLAAALAVLILTGPWLLQVMVDFTKQLIVSAGGMGR